MTAHELARLLLEGTDGEVLFQVDGANVRGVGDPLIAENKDGDEVVVLSPYGPKGHLELLDNDWWLYVQDVEWA